MVQHAYDVGVDITKILFNDGTLDKEVFVADLNGAGEVVNRITVDRIRFLTLESSGLIRAQKTRFSSALNFLNIGLQNLAQGDASDFFTPTLDGYNLNRGLEVVGELISSMTQLTPMTSLPLETGNLSLNLGKFFDNPPNADNVDDSAGDPFVYEENGDKTDIQLVENYFRAFLAGIAEF